jgi:3-hydroxyacyl-[acyl-carrier-protein] dehydratase
MAQVGAVLILSRPENWGRLIYFLGIERLRLRGAVRAGDMLEVEAEVKRLRSRIGTLAGRARVGGRRIAEGSMTFALGEARGGGA